MSKIDTLNELSRNVVDKYKEMTTMFCELSDAWIKDLTELNQTLNISSIRANIERMQSISMDFDRIMVGNRNEAEKHITNGNKSSKFYHGHRLEVERFVTDSLHLFENLKLCEGYEYFKDMVDSKEKRLRLEIEKYFDFLKESVVVTNVDAYAKEVMKQVEETRLKMGFTTKTAEDDQTTANDNFDWLKDW